MLVWYGMVWYMTNIYIHINTVIMPEEYICIEQLQLNDYRNTKSSVTSLGQVPAHCISLA